MAASSTLTKPPLRPKAAAPPVFVEETGYTKAERWIIMLGLMLGTILEVLDTSIVNVSIPQMMGNLGATLGEIGWVSTSYIIANVVILPLTGWLSSYFGRRRYLTYSIGLFVVASFLCGISRSLNELILFRILQGAGGAALLSSAQATLLEVFPRKQIGMVQAIFTIGVVFAPTVGPTVGGYITDHYSWPWIFFVNIPIGIFAGMLVWNYLKDSKFQTKPKGRIDIIGIAFLAAGLGSLQTILEKGNEEGWFQSNLIIGLSVVAFIALSAFLYWELTIEAPAVNLRVLKNVSFTSGTLIGFILGFGLYGGVFILPLFLQNIRGFTPTQTGLILFPGGIATVMALPFIGKAVSKIPAKFLVIAGAIVFAISMMQLSTLNVNTNPENLFYPLVLRGISMSLLFLPLSIAALAGLPNKDIPAGAGLYNLARQLGGSAGIASLSTLINHRTSVYRAHLGEYVSNLNPAAVSRMHALEHVFSKNGSTPAEALQKATVVISHTVTQQASVLAFEDAFQVIGLSFLLAIPVAMFLRSNRATSAAPADVH